jgi:hypothetical protein
MEPAIAPQNWIDLGKTSGRGRMDRHHRNDLVPKTIFVFPLCRGVQQALQIDRTAVRIEHGTPSLPYACHSGALYQEKESFGGPINVRSGSMRHFPIVARLRRP